MSTVAARSWRASSTVRAWAVDRGARNCGPALHRPPVRADGEHSVGPPLQNGRDRPWRCSERGGRCGATAERTGMTRCAVLAWWSAGDRGSVAGRRPVMELPLVRGCNRYPARLRRWSRDGGWRLCCCPNRHHPRRDSRHCALVRHSPLGDHRLSGTTRRDVTQAAAAWALSLFSLAIGIRWLTETAATGRPS